MWRALLHQRDISSRLPRGGWKSEVLYYFGPCIYVASYLVGYIPLYTQVDPSKKYESLGNMTYDATGQRINTVEAQDVQEKRDIFRDLYLYKTVSS